MIICQNLLRYYDDQPIQYIQLKDYFNKSTFFNQDGIINQTIQHIDIGQKMINHIINSYFGQQLSFNSIKNLLDKNWKFYNYYLNSKRAKQIPLYVFIFDFKGDKIFDVMKFLNLKQASHIGKTNILNQFHKHIGNASGFVTDLTNCCIMQLDSNHLSKQLILHELNHYFQVILKINLTNIDNVLIDIPKLHLTIQRQKQLFNEKEFLTYLFVDVIQNLNSFYWKYFKNSSKRIVY